MYNCRRLASVSSPIVFLFGLVLLSAHLISSNAGGESLVSLDTIRKVLVRQEDTIIFSLIERSKFPLNSKAYAPGFLGTTSSMSELAIRESEAVEARFGRYENPEEIPFFPDDIKGHPIVGGPYNFPKVLHPAGAWVNVSSQIWDLYFKQLLPLFTTQGDDGNYASTISSDLTCLQALARRIHYGKFVAEAKFRAAPNDYKQPILSKDRDTLIKLLTDDKVEEMVKQRVTKKAMVFGQDVTLNDTNNVNSSVMYKVDPAVVSRLYAQWVIPLTKVVELDYLLRRLN